MKMEVDDVDEILDQVMKIAPPTEKDDHKFLNLLRKLIERNVVVSPRPGLQELVHRCEERDLKTHSLALLRRELPAQLRLEFVEHIKQTKGRIGVQERLAQEEDEVVSCGNVDEYSGMREDIVRIKETIPDIQGKLRRAREIVEDAFEKSSGRSLDPAAYAENFFRSI